MSLSPLTIVLAEWLASTLVMVGLWLVQRGRRNAAILDVGWCVSFSLVVIWSALVVQGEPARRLLVAVLAGAWGFRLALHLYLDRVHGKPEDERYQTLRRQWGDRAQFYLFLLFQVEAVAIPLLSLPLLVLMQNPRPTFSLWELAGVLLWLAAVCGEWVADRQLARFRGDPANRGRTCRDGLWRYSRHPNYFFEALHWWAYVLMGVGVPFGWVTLLGPLLMTVALLRVSGFPLAEAQALASRGEDYRNYQRSTSAFIPWFPKQTGR